ncbi:unnamed protein product, partial [Rotaria sp. Silwood2]
CNYGGGGSDGSCDRDGGGFGDGEGGGRCGGS